MLQTQLRVVALFNPEEPVTPEMNAAFNDIWANNGDAVSEPDDFVLEQDDDVA